jgi:two-component system, cell cycle sensor histidine kinase PleC
LRTSGNPRPVPCCARVSARETWPNGSRTKIEAGRLELHDEPVALEELFEGCRRIVADRAAAAGLEVEFHPSELTLWADHLRVQQALLNLLSNAIKFTPAGGRISVTVDLTLLNEVRIAVQDTGIGIAAKDIAFVLEPFGQVSRAETRAQQGTGLGLPLVRKLVELHGGRMSLESTLGEGTTVTLTFPPPPDRDDGPLERKLTAATELRTTMHSG